MIKGNDDTRFGRRLESLFWWILRLAPLIVFFLMNFGYARAGTSNMATIGGVINDMFCEVSDANVVFDTISHVFYHVLEFFPNQDETIFYYLFYLVFIELARFFINFFLFIIRLANNLFDRFMR